MKIHFDNCNFAALSGPNVFANRLARQLFEMGHEIVDVGTNADVSLVFIEPSGKKLAKRVVQRLDGLWTKPDEFEVKNRNIKALYEIADVVIFQSEFDKNFAVHNWGLCRSSNVIMNGIKIAPVKEFTSPELMALRNQYDLVFTCSANWHPQKRLKANVELFLHLKKTLNANCCLIVMGANPDYVIANPHVFYAGSVPENIYMQVYSMSDWMIHLAWRDHSPNVCVECLSQRTPIICSSDGGTQELVGDFGIVIHENIANDNKPFDYDKPPIIDFNVIRSLEKPTRQPNDVSIETCANKYVKVFERVLQS